MVTRETTTGGVIERMVLPAFDRRRLRLAKQVPSESVLVGGHTRSTCSRRAARPEAAWPLRAAYLVLGGNGWTLRDFSTNGAFEPTSSTPIWFTCSPWRTSLVNRGCNAEKRAP